MEVDCILMCWPRYSTSRGQLVFLSFLFLSLSCFPYLYPGLKKKMQEKLYKLPPRKDVGKEKLGFCLHRPRPTPHLSDIWYSKWVTQKHIHSVEESLSALSIRDRTHNQRPQQHNTVSRKMTDPSGLLRSVSITPTAIFYPTYDSPESTWASC